MAMFIKEINKREENKNGGTYPKFATKKVIVKTHSDLMDKNKPNRNSDKEFEGFGMEIKDVSSVTAENVTDVFKYILEKLQEDPKVDQYEDFLWQHSTSRLIKPKEEEPAQEEGDDEDEEPPQCDDVKDMKLEKPVKDGKQKNKTLLQKIWPF
jgi:hypothetical protein